ncbi:MAG: ABC transporter substrate-binding protein [Clostridiales bacterium]|nr:ABC transporter substrate-binding protein [Clostridiales bacterium]
MRKVILFILLFFMLTSCQSNETIKIGVVGTMSGNKSELSVSGRRGIELAISKINEQGGLLGKEIEIIVKDDLNDVNRAVEVVKEFVDEDIEIVIGPFTSSMMLAAYDSIHAKEILYFSPTVSTDTLNEKDDQFIRFIAPSREQAIILNDVAVKNNHKKFIVIADETNFGFNQMLFQNFKEILEENNGQILELIEYTVLDSSMLDTMSAVIKNQDPDGVFVISCASDFAMVAQILSSKKIEVSMYGPLWAHTNDILRLGGEDIEHAYLVSGISYDNKNTDLNRVSLEYYDRYGEEMSFSAMYSYETMMALNSAIRKAHSSEWEKVKNALLDIKDYKGLQFQFTLDKYGDVNRPYQIDEVINGGFSTVED